MFGEDFRSVPIVQASIDGSLSPERNWSLGKAVTKLRCVYQRDTLLRTLLIPCCREEGILVLTGGLTVHNLQDRSSFTPETANPLTREFNDAVFSAISLSDVSIPHVNCTPFF
jgi:aromatic ring-opening dioxygenase catalytic subunit (LigB family)